MPSLLATLHAKLAPMWRRIDPMQRARFVRENHELRTELHSSHVSESELRNALVVMQDSHRQLGEKYQAAIAPPECADPANQLCFLFALPKSAGQALWAMLNQCWTAGPQSRRIPASLHCPNGLHVEMPVSDPVLIDFPQGGCYHTHAPATLMTLDFLRRRQVRHIVQVRHPLDQLVAYHCHIVKHVRQGANPTALWHDGMALTHPQAPVSSAAFAEGAPPAEAFDMLIRGGYLEATLNWIGQWCAFRDPKLSLVVTYEELVCDPRSVLLRAIEFFQPMLTLPVLGIDLAVNELESYGRRSREVDSGLSASAYERGYTGRVGVYRDYLTPQNIEAAKAVFERFCKESKYGPMVCNLYPDLENFVPLKRVTEERKGPQNRVLDFDPVALLNPINFR